MRERTRTTHTTTVTERFDTGQKKGIGQEKQYTTQGNRMYFDTEGESEFMLQKENLKQVSRANRMRTGVQVLFSPDGIDTLSPSGLDKAKEIMDAGGFTDNT